MLKKDRVLHAQAALHLQQGDPAAAQAIIRSNCFPTYGSDRGRLIAMWETSHMMQEEKTKGRPLTLFEQVHPLPCMAHPCMTHPTPTEKGERESARARKGELGARARSCLVLACTAGTSPSTVGSARAACPFYRIWANLAPRPT